MNGTHDPQEIEHEHTLQEQAQRIDSPSSGSLSSVSLGGGGGGGARSNSSSSSSSTGPSPSHTTRSVTASTQTPIIKRTSTRSCTNTGVPVGHVTVNSKTVTFDTTQNSTEESNLHHHSKEQPHQYHPKPTGKQSMGKSPGEIAFFKLLHSELKKAAKFFDRTKQEFILREERVREGMDIMRKPNSIMVSDKWSTMAKSIYRLYKDLLLLELYAIMTYCSFSKILKKHDKVTGYKTRIAFMANVVNKANFTHYPEVLAMIQRTEALFEEVSQKLLIEGNSALCEDERLFISMIHRFYGQIVDKAAEEGAPDADMRKRRGSGLAGGGSVGSGGGGGGVGGQSHADGGDLRAPSPSQKLSATRKDATSLKTLVEENDARVSAGSACLSDDPDDNGNTNPGGKRPFDSFCSGADTKLLIKEQSGKEKRKKIIKN
mmetsp:Transcript_3498/g.6620  ORF Transcript_3498/g.6620 Transcript_3498/m.6620 type:complete len:431 (-) Transcript_3498:286-1578(-)